MSRAGRCFWVLTLGALLVGCSTHRPAALPGAEAAVDAGETIEAGSTIRVTLHSGEVIAGVEDFDKQRESVFLFKSGAKDFLALVLPEVPQA